MQNPLIESFHTPFQTAPFHLIRNEHFLPAMQEAIARGKQEIEVLKANPEAPNFTNTFDALERAGELVNRIAEIFFNLNSAETNDEIQALAQEISPLLTDYSNDILLDGALFERIQAARKATNPDTLTPEQRTLFEKTYKGFVRNGALLDEEGKNRLREIDKRMAKLSLTFGENLLRETNAYLLVIEDEAELAGLPEFVREAAAETAKEKGREGAWAFTLDAPSYLPFMTYSANRARREELFRAFASRCFHGDQNDNREIVKEIAQLRQQRANLLGYKTHADFVLEERMAGSKKEVLDFLEYLLKFAKPAAERDMKTLADYARQLDGLDSLQRWDFAFYSEKLKKEKYSIDDELLKPYFPVHQVTDGIFAIAEKLYGIRFVENAEIPVYHPDVKAYEVVDTAGAHVGVFYADFYPRAGKRNGAWMTSFRGQSRVGGEVRRPHISIVCNFTKPTATKPSLLTFDEVTTFFHEFGHALHGLLADGTYESLTGTNVYWDFVELPSQIMENWAYEKECLDLFAAHYLTGEKIPADIIQRIRDSANFLSGYYTVRQISFGLLDMAWHGEDPSRVADVAQFERGVLSPTELFPPVEGGSTSCAFGHIFQGGYSSGYYSYKWAEVLDADAFAYFQEKGIFDPEVAGKFKQHILSAGGSEHPMTLYKRFRGQAPSPDALLKRAGLLETA